MRRRSCKAPFAPFASVQLVAVVIVVLVFLGLIVLVQFGRYLPPACSRCKLAVHTNIVAATFNFGSLLPAAYCCTTGSHLHFGSLLPAASRCTFNFGRSRLRRHRF